MYKWYCDICKTEIPKEDTGRLVVHNDALKEAKPSIPTVRLEVMVTMDGTTNKGDICRRCLYDILLLARPAPVECRHD